METPQQIATDVFPQGPKQRGDAKGLDRNVREHRPSSAWQTTGLAAFVSQHCIKFMLSSRQLTKPNANLERYLGSDKYPFLG